MPPSELPSTTATNGSAPQPPQDGDAPSIAVCCSGGGIRATAFSLGGLQGLGEWQELSKVRWLTAVSGGSYIATAYSIAAAGDLLKKPSVPDASLRPRNLSDPLVGPRERAARARDRMTCPEPPDSAIEMGPYALGSPEERYLRSDSRYLVPDAAVGLRGAFFLFGGIIGNLLLLLPILFVAAHLVGIGLRWTAGTAIERGGTLQLGWGPYVAIGLVSAAGLLVILDGVVAAFRSLPRTLQLAVTQVTLWLMVGAAVAALLLIGLPAMLSWLNHTALYGTGWSGKLLHHLGFAPAGQCQTLAVSRPATAGLCQSTAGVVEHVVAKPAFTGTTSGNAVAGSGLLALLLALLTRVTIGRTAANEAGTVTAADLRATGRKLAMTKPGKSVVAAVRRYLTPWIGSLVIVAVFLMLGLRWSLDGAIGSAVGEIWPLVIAAGIGVGAKLFISVNRTSLHRFYRERLSSAFGVIRRDARVEQPNTLDSTDVIATQTDLRLSDLDPTTPAAALPLGYGRPELVICAAANVRGVGVPTGRGAISFTFTPTSSGLAGGRGDLAPPAADSRGRARRVSTLEYENYCGTHVLGLFDMVAMSGAALSPLMGKLTRPSLRILLAMANVRLGVWLPNPAVVSTKRPMIESFGQRHAFNAATWLDRMGTRGRRILLNLWQPGALALAKEMWGSCRIDGRWLYITDGGHFENLGLVEALRRKPSEVFIFDASGESPGSFSALGQAIALARTDLSVQIRFPGLDEGGDKAPPVPFQIGTATYPDGTTVRLCYAKAMRSMDAPWDVQSYANAHPSFPHDSAGQQLYDEQEFEAYRSLGRDAVGRLLDARKALDADPKTAASTTVDLNAKASPASAPEQRAASEDTAPATW